MSIAENDDDDIKFRIERNAVDFAHAQYQEHKQT